MYRVFFSNGKANASINSNNGLDDSLNNMTLLQEDDFCITPSDCIIWEGYLPWDTGDKFPTEDIEERASIYKTYNALYNNDFKGIYDNVVGINDYLQNPLTNMPVFQLTSNLPDYHTMVTMWQNFTTSNPPKVNIIDVENS